jgi:hypothetical protein
MRHAGPVDRDGVDRLRLCLGAVASAIGPGLNRNRRELRFGPKPLWRQHRLGKIETKELIGTVFVRDHWLAQRQQRRTEDGGENTFRGHVRPPEILENGTTLYLGSGRRVSSGTFQQGYRSEAGTRGTAWTDDLIENCTGTLKLIEIGSWL